MKPSKKERAMGAILGTLIGDALSVGPHWYYDLEQKKKDYGDWVTDYTAPQADRYHAGLKPGQTSQTGQVTVLLLESAAQGYQQDDFTNRLDQLLATLDGTPQGGRYTDEAMRDVWRQRQKEQRPWSRCGSWVDTAEAAVRAPILAAHFYDDLNAALSNLITNMQLTHRDPFIAGRSTTFGLITQALINGVPLKSASVHVRHKIEKTGRSLYIPVETDGTIEGASFIDAVLLPQWSVQAAEKLQLEPVILLPLLLGMACGLESLLPAAYYLAAKYEGDFETAVLTAVNSGGNNMARAALTGALAGAQVGLSGIPARFIEGLEDSARILEMAEKAVPRS